MHTVQTNKKVVTIGMLFGEDDWEEFRHIKGLRVCIVCVYVNGRQKNEQRHKKKRKRARANGCRQLVYKQMLTSTERAKNSRRNLVIRQINFNQTKNISINDYSTQKKKFGMTYLNDTLIRNTHTYNTHPLAIMNGTYIIKFFE